MGIPVALDIYEATALVSYAQGDTCHCRPEFDIKMFGPGHHEDGIDCCWWLFCINADGNGSVTREKIFLLFLLLLLQHLDIF